MNENDLQEIIAAALAEYSAKNDLPLDLKTLQEKGFSEEAGLIISLGSNEFHLNIHQTVFDGE